MRELWEVKLIYREYLIYRHRAAPPPRHEPEVLNYVTWRNLEAVEAWRTRLRGYSTLVAAHSPLSLAADRQVSTNGASGRY